MLQDRRVIVAIAVVLTLLAIGAGIASSPPKVSDGSSDRGAPAQAAAAELQVRRLRIGARRGQVVKAAAGQELQLTVSGAQDADVVELERLDLEQQISPDLPAVFDLLPTEPGNYVIRLVGSDRPVGTLRVTG